jgi:hypothetical protein
MSNQGCATLAPALLEPFYVKEGLLFRAAPELGITLGLELLWGKGAPPGLPEAVREACLAALENALL